MGFRAMICTLAMTLLGVAGMGNADTYTCKITKSSRGGWVTQDYIFVVDAQNRASVYDGAVHFAYGKPIWATITERTDSITRLTWGVAGLPASNRATGSSAGKFSLKYSAVLNTAKQTVSVRGTVMQGGGGSNGSGTCKVKAGGSAANALSTTTGNASIPDKSGPGGGGILRAVSVFPYEFRVSVGRECANNLSGSNHQRVDFPCWCPQVMS